ncbi:MAG: EAL domain-containing protein, partial [Betaproteobacteria bacterium]
MMLFNKLTPAWVFLWIFIASLSTGALANDSPKILVLHSYHQGFEWTDSVHKAFSETITASYPKAEVFVEYMNTKRQSFGTMAPQLSALYKHTYSNVAFDVIVASDNNALDFLLLHRDSLFPGVPVVFCGINDIFKYRFDPASGYTGISEASDIAATIAIGLKLHPGTRKVILLSDATETGSINIELAKKVTAQFPAIAFTEMADLTATQLSSELKALADDTIVLNLGFYRDSAGRAFAARESMNFILSASPRPIYTLWDFAMAPGALGGKLISGRLQGENAAALTTRILRGEKAGALPIIDSPTAYTFDHEGLKKFNIDESLLPEGAIVTGRPDTFYSRYKTYLWFGSALFAAQIMIIGLLLSNIARRRREELARKEAVNALRETNQMFSLFMLHSPVNVFIKELSATGSRVLMASENFKTMIGISGSEMVGKGVSDLFPAEFADEISEADKCVMEKGEMLKADVQLHGRSYTTIRFPLVQGEKTLIAGYFIDITERQEYEKQLKHIAHYDVLTTLPNRVLLGDRLHQAMLQSERRGQLLAVAYLDLDGFKEINDHHGHETGDQLLIALAGRMKQDLRDGDTLARLGGDEFVAVMLDLPDIAACVPMLTRLLSAAAQPVLIDDLVLQVSASLGVTFYPQTETVDADQLLRQADQAMYQAKLAGKNRYHVFDAEQDRSVRGHHESVERIRQALGEQEFVLYYQPKVNMRTGEVIGAEALIRWQHPELGLLSPASFLPVIEDHTLAVDVGGWVIETALSQIERWKAVGLNIPVSVNIGARQFQQPDFVDRLHAALDAHPDIQPGDLEMEVLETSALDDLARVAEVIEACREIGVLFSLDDFGTGYSSLTYLKHLSVNQLKIDQSFVRDMLDDPDDLAILGGVLGLASSFRRQVIAEGVETVEHGVMLLQLGCELAQGYGIARPMPA